MPVSVEGEPLDPLLVRVECEGVLPGVEPGQSGVLPALIDAAPSTGTLARTGLGVLPGLLAGSLLVAGGLVFQRIANRDREQDTA